MNIIDVPLALTGDKLFDQLGRIHDKRVPLAEGFLYEHTINMISAEPGTGKSTISTQIAVELSTGVPVFGIFEVKKPLKVLLVQTERSIIEVLERLDLINKTIPLNRDNLFITAEYQRFNLLRPDHAEAFIACVKRDCPEVNLIVIDPIYCMVAGGLKDDVPASIFTKTMSTLQKETGATLYYNHHTTKPQYHEGSAIKKTDPFYGSQWLKAHATTMYHLAECDGGVKLTLTKDNYKLMTQEITLTYDGETGLCSVNDSELPALERVKRFLHLRDLDKKEFTFKDMEAHTKVCTRRLREMLLHSQIRDRLIVVSAIKNRHLYKTAQSHS